MPAYVLVETDITDPERYEQYKAAGSLSVAAAGGRYLVRGGELVVLEGDWHPSRLVVLEVRGPRDREALVPLGGLPADQEAARGCSAPARGRRSGRRLDDRRPQPQRRAGRLHRLLHHREQLGAERLFAGPACGISSA